MKRKREESGQNDSLPTFKRRKTDSQERKEHSTQNIIDGARRRAPENTIENDDNSPTPLKRKKIETDSSTQSDSTSSCGSSGSGSDSDDDDVLSVITPIRTRPVYRSRKTSLTIRGAITTARPKPKKKNAKYSDLKKALIKELNILLKEDSSALKEGKKYIDDNWSGISSAFYGGINKLPACFRSSSSLSRKVQEKLVEAWIKIQSRRLEKTQTKLKPIQEKCNKLRQWVVSNTNTTRLPKDMISIVTDVLKSRNHEALGKLTKLEKLIYRYLVGLPEDERQKAFEAIFNTRRFNTALIKSLPQVIAVNNGKLVDSYLRFGKSKFITETKATRITGDSKACWYQKIIGGTKGTKAKRFENSTKGIIDLIENKQIKKKLSKALWEIIRLLKVLMKKNNASSAKIKERPRRGLPRPVPKQKPKPRNISSLPSFNRSRQPLPLPPQTFQQSMNNAPYGLSSSVGSRPQQNRPHFHGRRVRPAAYLQNSLPRFFQERTLPSIRSRLPEQFNQPYQQSRHVVGRHQQSTIQTPQRTPPNQSSNTQNNRTELLLPLRLSRTHHIDSLLTLTLEQQKDITSFKNS